MTKEEEWNFFQNKETIKNLQEFDKWLEELSKKNGITKYQYDKEKFNNRNDVCFFPWNKSNTM